MSLTVSVRIEGKKSGASGGQKSHDMREGKQPEYVDAKRSNQNSVLIEPMTALLLASSWQISITASAETLKVLNANTHKG